MDFTRQKKNLGKTTPFASWNLGIYTCFFFCFVVIIKNQLRTIGLNHCPVICGVQLEGG